MSKRSRNIFLVIIVILFLCGISIFFFPNSGLSVFMRKQFDSVVDFIKHLLG